MCNNLTKLSPNTANVTFATVTKTIANDIHPDTEFATGCIFDPPK